MNNISQEAENLVVGVSESTENITIRFDRFLNFVTFEIIPVQNSPFTLGTNKYAKIEINFLNWS